MRGLRRIVVIGLATAAVGIVATVELQLGSAPPDKVDVLSDLRGKNVSQQYQDFASQQDAAGGDSNIMVPLGRARGHGSETGRATGVTRIDMQSGKITAQVSGLDTRHDYDLWLVDNVNNPGESAMPDADDKMVRVGSFSNEGSNASLTGQVDVVLYDRFQIDMVVVSRAGEQPDQSSELLGSMTLFQRVYSALGSSRRLLASDFAQYAKHTKPEGSVLSVRSAYAMKEGEQNPFVDADVVFSNLVKQGSDLFFNERFGGNGRTCGTCHPTLHNLTIDVPFIEDLPDDDPLFVAEFVPALAANFENPRLMRGAALIQENLDGFNDLAKKFVMRSVMHTFALARTSTPPNIPFDNTAPPNSNFAPGFPAARLGWGGDGAPNSGSLRDFATGAVTQHFPLTLARVNGRDFRLPTAAQLDAMEAFQLALGRNFEINLAATKFRDPRVRLGRDMFNRLDTGNPPKPTLGFQPNTAPQGPPLPAGKCTLCHSNAGATLNSAAITQILNSVPPGGVPPITGNANFATGVNDLAALPANILDPTKNPRDGGFGLIPHDNRTNLPQVGNRPCIGGRGGFGVVTLAGGALPPGLCEEDFNTQPLIEAADTPPFFHNNAVNTIESAVMFYTNDVLNNAVGGQLLRAIDTNGIGIKLDTTQVTAIASMLRVLNANENIRQALDLLNGLVQGIGRIAIEDGTTLLDQMLSETEDAIKVLSDGHLHPVSVKNLKSAANLLRAGNRINLLNQINNALIAGQRDLIDP